MRPRRRPAGKRYTLALWQDGRVIDVENGNVWTPQDAHDLRDIAWKNKLLIGTEDVGRHPWLLDIIGMEKGVKTLINKGMMVASIAFVGTGWGALQDLKTFQVYCPEDWVGVRRFFNHVGYDGITVGAVADSLMWGTLKHVKIPPPCSFRVREVFEENAYGGRTILAQKREFFSELWEIDFNKAYLRWICSVPDPNAVPTVCYRWNVEDERPAFVRASLVSRECAIAPLLCRPAPNRAPKSAFKDGEHLQGWWWSDELRAAKAAGWDVIVKEALVWPQLSRIFVPWAEVMLEKIETAPDQFVKDLMKFAYSAQIGRFQMRSEKLELRHGEARAGGHPLMVNTPDGGVTISDQFWIEQVEGDPGPTVHYLPQGSYIVMKTRLDMYNVALEMFQKTGFWPVRGHVDNLYYPIEPPVLDSVGFGAGLGKMKVKKHLNATVEANRVVSTDETGKGFRVLPGISGPEREIAAGRMSKW